MAITYVDILDQYARTRGDDVFITDDGASCTFADFRRKSLIVSRLLSDLEVKAGDRVGLFCLNTIAFPLFLFGAWRLGATVVPIDHKFTTRELDYVLEHASIKFGLFDKQLERMVAASKVQVKWFVTGGELRNYLSFDDELERLTPLDLPSVPVDNSTLAEVLYTSGTTGRPKGCLHTHTSIYNAGLMTCAGFLLSGADRVLIAMPIWHSSPLNNWLLGTLLVGGQVFLLREYEPKRFIEALESYKITFTFGSPIAFLAPLHTINDMTRYDLSHLRMCTYGGGPLGATMVKRLREKYGAVNFVQVYGMTETGPNGTALFSWEAQGKEGSIGRNGTPGMEVQVRDGEDEICGPNQVGEIYLRSPAMMKGYLNDPAATAEVLDRDGWYRSGDIARLDSNGYMYIMDRSKDMIITGGENVYSKEVEDAISGHPSVMDVAVVSEPHPEWGETVVAVMVARGESHPDDNEMRKYLEDKLARYKVPRVYMWWKELPRTPSGKLRKYEIRKTLNSGTGSAN